MAKVIETVSNAIKYWYVPLIIGILLVVFGIYIFTVPAETYGALALIFAIYFVVSGALEIFFSISNREEIDSWMWYLVGGVLALLIGVVLLVYPDVSQSVLPFFVGFTILFKSLQLIGLAFDLKRFKVLSWGNIAIAGIIGMIVSFILVINPIFTGISIVILTGLSFIIVGVGAVLFAFDLKKIKSLPKKIKEKILE